MAFGYFETAYDVSARHEMLHAGMRQVFEQRQERPCPGRAADAGASTYLSVEGFDNEGRLVMDVLLLYRAQDAEHLAGDWARLCSEPELRLDELRWFERIDGHGTGRRRDGVVCMY